MRLSRNSIQKAVAGVVVGAGLAVATTASAGIVYDLRLAPGTVGSSNGGHDLVSPTASTAYTMQLWVQISGTDSDNTNEGMTNAFVAVQSTQANGGMIHTGGITTGTRIATLVPWNGSGSRAGSGSDLNGDGVTDWGSASTDLANTNYMLVRTTRTDLELNTVPDVTAGAVAGNVGTVANRSQAVNANTWEFHVADFVVNTGASLGTGGTLFKVNVPGTQNSLSAPLISTYTQDAPLDAANGLYTLAGQQNLVPPVPAGTFDSPGHFVTFGTATIIPEPASLGLLGMVAVGLLRRRR